MPLPVPAHQPTRRSNTTSASSSSTASTTTPSISTSGNASTARRLVPAGLATTASTSAEPIPKEPSLSQQSSPARRIIPPKVVSGLAGSSGPAASTPTRVAGLRGPMKHQGSPLPSAPAPTPQPEIVAEVEMPREEDDDDDADGEEDAEAGDEGGDEGEVEEDEDDDDDKREEQGNSQPAGEDDGVEDDENDGDGVKLQMGTRQTEDGADDAAAEEETPGSGSSGQWKKTSFENSFGNSFGGSFGGVSTDTGGDDTELDPQTEVETEEPASEEVTGNTGSEKKTVKISDDPPMTTTTKASTARDSDREKQIKEERDKAKMPPPPKRTTATGAKDSARSRGNTKGTTANAGGTGISKQPSTRRGTTTKDGNTSGKEATRATSSTAASKGAESSIKSTRERKSSTATTVNAPSTTRHTRTRSITSSSSRQNGPTANTDSEDPSAKRTGVTKSGVVKKARPVSMVATSSKVPTEKGEEASPPSPTSRRTRSSTITKDKDPQQSSSSLARKASTRTGTAVNSAGGTSERSHRRNPSEAQSTSSTNTRPAFTTFQQDFSAIATPSVHQAQSINNSALLPDAPTLQKQTHLLQLLLLHNTAISSFQALHASAREKLEARYNALTQEYGRVHHAEAKVARRANLFVLRRVLEESPRTMGAGVIDAATGRMKVSSSGGGRRKTLTGDIASQVEEKIQVLSESVKRLEGLLRPGKGGKGGEVTKLRAEWERWVRSVKGGGTEGVGDGEGGPAVGEVEGLPKQWHKEYAGVKRKVEGAVEGVREFWSAYQHLLDAPQLQLVPETVSGDGVKETMSTLGRIVFGYLELGEDVVRELEEMRVLEKVIVEEGRERIRQLVRRIMQEDAEQVGEEAQSGERGVARDGEAELVGAERRVPPAWR